MKKIIQVTQIFISNLICIDKSVRMKTKEGNRALNNSVQYSTHLEDLSPPSKPQGPAINIFSVSDKDTTNTTEDTSKYYSTSVNFNKFAEDK